MLTVTYVTDEETYLLFAFQLYTKYGVANSATSAVRITRVPSTLPMIAPGLKGGGAGSVVVFTFTEGG